jgi:hypothetical protein
MALETVQDYLARARDILQDTIEPYRYTNEHLVEGLNMGIMEARRIRPESVAAYLGDTLPEYSTANLSATVDIDQMQRPAFVYYICGHAHLRDNEIAEGSRAAAFLNKFVAQMLTTQA